MYDSLHVCPINDCGAGRPCSSTQFNMTRRSALLLQSGLSNACARIVLVLSLLLLCYRPASAGVESPEFTTTGTGKACVTFLAAEMNPSYVEEGSHSPSMSSRTPLHHPPRLREITWDAFWTPSAIASYRTRFPAEGIHHRCVDLGAM